mmetsp:Transcript_32860/g.90661  ORF Transcript_32860/g.90661 Transcript_32860/m.90661 type:complete len:577 (-) Transcript_32860:101-1831(-)
MTTAPGRLAGYAGDAGTRSFFVEQHDYIIRRFDARADSLEARLLAQEHLLRVLISSHGQTEVPHTEVSNTRTSSVQVPLSRGDDRPQMKPLAPKQDITEVPVPPQEKHSSGGESAIVTMEREDDARQRAARRHSINSTTSIDPQSWSLALPCWQRFSRRIVASGPFETIAATMIILNSVYIGVEVNHMVVKKLDTPPMVLSAINHAFNVFFVVELALRSCAEGGRCLCRRDWKWFVVDTIIVFCSCIETLFDVFKSVDGGEAGFVDHFGGMRIVRIIRIARLLRIVRVTRIVRFVRALRTLIFSIACTLKSLAWAMLLLLIIIYVFALVVTQAVGEYMLENTFDEPDAAARSAEVTSVQNGVLNEYWGTLPRSMFTLFKSITGGVNWDDVAKPFNQVHIIWEVAFAGFIIFAHLAVLNVVTSVFCQSAMEGAQHDHYIAVQAQIANKASYVKRMQALFKNVDSDDSGVITYEELEQHLGDRQVRAFFESMDLETSDAWTLFKLLDRDMTHEIDIEEFVDGCLRLRGVAKSIDMARLLHETKWALKSISQLSDTVRTEVRMLATMHQNRPQNGSFTI